MHDSEFLHWGGLAYRHKFWESCEEVILIDLEVLEFDESNFVKTAVKEVFAILGEYPFRILGDYHWHA